MMMNTSRICIFITIYRSLVKIWEREASTKQMNGGYSALESNFSCGLGGVEPGGEHVKHEPGTMHGRALYPSNVGHPHQGGQYTILIA